MEVRVIPDSECVHCIERTFATAFDNREFMPIFNRRQRDAGCVDGEAGGGTRAQRRIKRLPVLLFFADKPASVLDEES